MANRRNADDLKRLEKLVEGLSHDSKDFFNSLSEHERLEAIKLYLETIETGETKKYDLLWEADYLERPVSVQQFLTDDFYMGSVGRDLFPCWTEEMIKLFGEPNYIKEVIVSGAIGIGKTTFAMVALARKLYEILCVRNPTQFYGLSKDMSQLVFGLFNITMKRSQDIHQNKLVKMLNSSPFFRYKATGNVEELEEQGGKGLSAILHMPNNIKFAFGSRALHVLGADVIAGLLDETNFSVLAEDFQVLDLYRNVRRRIDSRFPAVPGKGWKSPGLLFLVSSSKGEEDFLEKRSKDESKASETRVISKSVWEAKKHIAGMYSGKNFRVMIGSGEISSKVLDEGEVPGEDCEVIEVPTEHKIEFLANVDEALMDLGGRAMSGGARKMVQIEKIRACIFKDMLFRHKRKLPVRHHPFTRDEIFITLDGPTCIEDYVIAKELVRCTDRHRKKWEPIVNPDQGRFIHLDPATSGKYSYGLAMCHVAGFKEVLRRDPVDFVLTKVKAPYIYLDFVLKISHPPGKEIDLAKIRAFIMWLRNHGYPIHKVTADGFQSTDTIQTLKKQYFDAELYSVDKKPEAYSVFRQTIQEERLLFCDYPVFLDELGNLQRDADGKAFHLPDKLKDTCLRGNTEIVCLEGTYPSIQDLYDRREKDFWVVAFDQETRKYVPAVAKRVKRTKLRNKQLLKITLDDGSVEYCTPDHEWMVRSGDFVQARELKPGDSMMPYYESEITRHKDTYKVFEDPITVDVEDDYVYDLVMDKYHNFALKSGVVSHNCDAVCGAVSQVMMSKDSLFSVAKPLSSPINRRFDEPITEAELIMPEIPYGEHITGIG
jgi:hypothetical protein